jgi:hypothetical protein
MKITSSDYRERSIILRQRSFLESFACLSGPRARALKLEKLSDAIRILPPGFDFYFSMSWSIPRCKATSSASDAEDTLPDGALFMLIILYSSPRSGSGSILGLFLFNSPGNVNSDPLNMRAAPAPWWFSTKPSHKTSSDPHNGSA